MAAGAAALCAAAGATHGQPCEYAWSPVGEGVSGGFITRVDVLAVFDDGSGPSLCAAGHFDTAGSARASYIARWDGASWSPLGEGFVGGWADPGVRALAVFDHGAGPMLHAGGNFAIGGSGLNKHLGRWEDGTWLKHNFGIEGSTYWVGAMSVFDDGAGADLYVGGSFPVIDGRSIHNIARWDGAQWSSLGLGMAGWVRVLTVFDHGAGPNLYAGGAFTIASDIAASRVARWDGAFWWPLGEGVNDWVWALAEFDDGSGPALYAGGFFTTAGGEPASHIAKWDGDGWSPLGSGVNGWVYTMEVFDDGSGPALYVGGLFTEAGGEPANYIARWDGAEWSPVGAGMNERVRALAVFDDGAGPALYAGGEFTEAGGMAASRIAKWSCQPPACYPDCDADGELTFFDFLCFQDHFAALTAYADCDHSGIHDVFDFLCFQNAFAAGCP